MITTQKNVSALIGKNLMFQYGTYSYRYPTKK